MNPRYLVVLALIAAVMVAGCAGGGEPADEQKAADTGAGQDIDQTAPAAADEELPTVGEVELDIEDIGLSGEELTAVEDMGSAEGLEGTDGGSGLDEISVFG